MKPRIAVLIPAYNEELVITNTIEALLVAGCDKNDIYVVDDCSRDKTVEIVKELGVNVAKTRKNGGKANAQKYALRYFLLCERYKYIVFMDGDTLIDANFFNAMRAAAEETPDVSLFLGQVRSIKSNNLFSASRSIEYAYGQDIVKVGQDNFNVIFVAPGCASMYSSNVLRYLDIDAQTLAEDMDLTMQVHHLDKKVRYVSKAAVNTQDPNTFRDYMKQVYRWYRGFWQVAKKHKVFHLTLQKKRVDWYMVFVALDALLLNRIVATTLFTQMFSSLMIGMALDFCCYLLLAIYTSIRRRRLDVIYKAPITFFVDYVNFFAFARGFLEIMVLRRNPLTWNKVSRYNIA